MTGSTYVSFFFGLIVSAVVARSVGPADFGRYAYVVWISGILVQFANNGLNTTGIRFISENLGRNDRQTASDVHGWLLGRQYVCLAIASVGFLAGMPWMLPSGWNAHIALFGGVVLVSLISKALYLFDVSVAKGYGEYSVEAVSNTSITAVNLMLALVLYAFDAPLASYLALFALTSIAYGVSTWFLLRGRGISRTVATLEPGMETRLRQHLVWTVVLTLAAALGNKASETYLLSTYGSPAEIGFFAIATALTRGGVELLSAGLNTVLMPLMGHAYGAGGTQRVNDILGHSTRYYGFAGLLLAGVGFFWAGPAIVLMYGAQYQAAVPVFKVMVIVAGVTLSQGAFGALLSTTDRQRIRAFVALFSVCLSTLIAVLLVPRYGLSGAVWAHAASSALIFLAIGVGVVKAFTLTLPWRELSRLFASAVLAAAAAAALRWVANGVLPDLLAGAMYGLVFIASTFVLKSWTTADLSAMKAMAQRVRAFRR